MNRKDIPSTSSQDPMEVDSIEEEDDDADDMNGIVHGVDVKPHVARLHSSEGGQEEPQDDLVNAINMFMRNEYDYDEFMRVTGGQTLQEELGAGKNRKDTLDVEEVDTADDEEDDEDAELMEEVEEMSVPRISNRYDAIPEEARYIMTQIMAGDDITHPEAAPESPKNLADALKTQYDRVTPPLKQVKTEISATTTDAETATPPPDTRHDRGKTKRLDAMLGHANVQAARGKTTDALELLKEVIRQDHRNYMAYQQIATVYEQMGEHRNALQFGLLSSHLDPHTAAEDWVHWGDQAKEFGMLEEAAVCYDRALRVETENWKYYEKRIEVLDQLNLRPLAMKARLLAAQKINHQLLDIDFKWFHDLIRQVAQYYITMNDEEKAILALEAFVLRSHEFGEKADAQHETLVGMYLGKNQFQAAGKSIVALCKGIRPVFSSNGETACLISYTNGTYECVPFPPMGSVEYEIDEELFPVNMHCHLVICLFCLNEIDQSTDLEERLLKRKFTVEDVKPLLDVSRAYDIKGNPDFAKKFLIGLSESSYYDFETSADYWYLKGRLEMQYKKSDLAMECFEKVLHLQPDHVDNRIHLSTLQQKAGMFDKALETLQDYDLESCSAMPDERLLARQSDVLFESGQTELFVRTTRMMLAPHFFTVYSMAENGKKRRMSKSKTIIPALSSTLRTAALNAVKHTNWERLVKRLGTTVESQGGIQTTLTATDLHDYCLKLIESLNKLEKHSDALIVCCYAFLHPMLQKEDKGLTFQNLIYFCAIKAKCWPLAFEFSRFFYTFALTAAQSRNDDPAAVDMKHKRLFNAMNYVFVNSQNVCYHRFIMRALVKSKENHALQAISGNNSLITGTYRHAMGEYLRVWVNNKRNPLICLLLALTFTHMSCKKDLSSRHLISIRGIAFMKKYSKVRTCHQEVYYNTARMFHQMSILPLAKHFYQKVLEVDPPNIYTFDEDGNEIIVTASKYDLRKMAAHNLALMYRTAGNNFAARELYKKYLVI